MEKVVQVTTLPNKHLKLVFADGYMATLDMRPFIVGGISEDLQDEHFFAQVQLDEQGGIAWPNGYDFCPNFLRELATQPTALTN